VNAVGRGGEPLGPPARHADQRRHAARLIRATPVATAAAPTIIGVDDWALRKRTRYGTIIVDLERRRPIDLLPDRNAETLAAWLQARPGISLVARDRSAAYRRAITAGAPSAVQVAD